MALAEEEEEQKEANAAAMPDLHEKTEITDF